MEPAIALLKSSLLVTPLFRIILTEALGPEGNPDSEQFPTLAEDPKSHALKADLVGKEE